MKVTVVSTGFAPAAKARCLASVAAQQDVEVEHLYVDASEQSPPKTCAENLFDLITPLPPDRVVAWVDLDDRLLRTDALALIAKQHEAGAWVTYGSYRCKDGRPGIAAPYGPDESIRRSPWRATHLKTFRAGLFQCIKREHLQFEGEWLHRAVDMAIMMPILEMAWHGRRTFVPEILVEYNYGASFEWNATNAEREIEKDRDRYVRGLPAYERLESP